MTSCLVICGLLLSLRSAQAQTLTGGAPFKRPVDEPLAVPDYETPEAPQPLQLPPVEAPAEDAPLSRQLKIYVQTIRLQGNTVFTDAELGELTAPYEHRFITAGELETLRRALTLHYVDHGYINSGVQIPDQKVVNGVITLSIVEGRLSEIRPRGLHGLRPSYIDKRIYRGVERPLNIDDLSGTLQLLQQNPRIKRLNAALVPGTAAGEAILDVLVNEAAPFDLWLGADNARPPAVGGEQAFVRGLHRNFTGWGDTLAFEVGVTDGLQAYDFSYAVPVTAADTELMFRLIRNDSVVVEDPFDTLNIHSDERSYIVNLLHPAYRTLNRTLLLGAGIERRKSKTSLLDQPFSFSPGAENGVTQLWVLRASQEWRDQSRVSVLAARSTFSLGMDIFDATVNGEDGDGEFFSWLGQLQMAHRLGRQSQVIVRAALQLANDALPSLEQFSVGGLYTVRGYRENQQVSDQGLNASLEFRVPFWTSDDGRSKLQIAPFYDYGAVWNRHRPTPGPQYFSGVGAGVLLNYKRKLDAALYYAHAFQDFDNPSDDLQDDGIHFSVTLKLF